MPVTPVYNFPYPALSDSPNGPAQFSALALAVEDELERIDNAILPMIPYTNSLASIINPTVDQLAYLTTTRNFYRYVGASVWVLYGTIGSRTVSTAGIIQTTSGTTELNITKLALENTRTESGTWYVLNLNLTYNHATVAAGDSYLVRIRKDTALSGTTLAEFIVRPESADTFDGSKTFAQPWLSGGQDTDADFYVSIQRVAGTGTLGVYGNSHTAFWIDEKTADSAVWTTVA
jgi:hypothetical protein